MPRATRMLLLALATAVAAVVLVPSAAMADDPSQFFSSELPGQTVNGTPSAAQYRIYGAGSGYPAQTVTFAATTTADTGHTAPDPVLSATPSASTTTCTTSAGGATVTCQVPAVGAASTVEINLQLATTRGKGQVVLTARTGTGASAVVTATTSTRAVDPDTDLSLTRTSLPPKVLAGPVDATFTIRNNATTVAHEVALGLTADPGLAVASCDGCAAADLPGGATRTVVVHLTATLVYDPAAVNYTAGRRVGVTATASDTSARTVRSTPTTANRVDVYTNTLDSDLTLTGVPTAETVLVGGAATFRYVLRSTGSARLSGIHVALVAPGLDDLTASLGGVSCPTVIVTDDPVLVCGLDGLAPGSTVDLVVRGVGAEAGTAVVRGGVATDSFSSPLPGADSGSAFVQPGHVGYVEVVSDGFDLRTSATATSSGAAGAPITFAATLTNVGTTRTAASRLSAPVPAGTTVASGVGCQSSATVVVCDAGPLAPGASVAVSFTVATPGAGTYATTFTASGDGPIDPGTGMSSFLGRDVNPADNTATVAVTLPTGTTVTAAPTGGVTGLVADVGSLASTRLGKAARKGLSLPATCNQACRVTTTLTVTGKDAKRLGAKGKVAQPRPIGSGSSTTFKPGTLVVPITLTTPAKRGVAGLRGKKPLTAILTTTIESVGGILTRSTPVQLRR